jgi:N-acetylmuramoyl-L-alanine amidase
MAPLRRTAAVTAAVLVLLFASFPQAQGTPPASPLLLLTRAGRRPVPTTIVGGPEMIALDDVGSLFQATVREDSLAGGVTVTYRGRTIAASAGQSAVSVAGRLVSLPAPVLHSGRRWLVPIEFLPRALGLIYDQRIDLRRDARLLIVGDLRVPRVTAHIDVPGPPTHVTIEISPAATVTAAAQDGRITLRIDADALDLALPQGGGLVEQFRAGDQPNTVVVTLTAGAGTPRIATTAAPNLTRVTIDIASAAAPGQTAAPVQPTPPTTPGAVPAPAQPARSGIATIAIDPGHGGDDVGARGPGGVEEKAVTLDVARRLKNLIETRLGLRVVMTREDDRAVGLDDRTAIANNSKADLLLSLHANAALTPSMSGAEVYYLKSTADLEQARRDAESDAVTLPVLGGGTRLVDMIRWDMAQARHLDQSQAFASVLSQELDAKVPASPRPLQQALLRVLEGADMPAAEVELLYLTNPDQAKQAASDDFKNTLAQALFDAIVKFRTMPEAAAR